MKLVKSKKGMSLIEVIISLAILGIVSVGIIGFFTDSFKFQARIQEISKAQKVADAIMEDIKINGVTNNTGEYDFAGVIYEYEVTSAIAGGSSGDNIVGGIELYEIIVKVNPKGKSFIVGTANSTMRKKINSNHDKFCRITYVKRIIGGDEDLFSEDFFGEGTYNVNPFVPGDRFEGWQINGSGPLYGYTDDSGYSQIEIDEDMLGDTIELYASFK